MEGFIFGLTCYQNMLSYMNMNSTHRKTLKLIFDKTVAGSLKWQRIEALFLALGAQAIEGRGSPGTIRAKWCCGHLSSAPSTQGGKAVSGARCSQIS